jgi:predicted methyltransferase
MSMLDIPLRRRAATSMLLAMALPFAASSKTPIDDDTDGARLRATIDGPQRSAANRARDAARHPFETLRFFGLTPSQTVVEIAPGSGWYTEILAPYLRDHGSLYLAHYPANAADEQERQAHARFQDKLAKSPEVYGRAVLGSLPDGRRGFTDIAPPGGADAVLTFRNVHNWIESDQLDHMLHSFFAVLKAGGTLGVEEHRAAPGTSLAQVVASGYVPEALVIARARAAGFEWVGSSEVNSNSGDTKNHPNGVWSLPPTLRGGETDRARLIAIGESDRMTLKFVKPLR